MSPLSIPRTKICPVFEGGLDYSDQTRLKFLSKRKLNKGSENKKKEMLTDFLGKVNTITSTDKNTHLYLSLEGLSSHESNILKMLRICIFFTDISILSFKIHTSLFVTIL